MATLEDKREYLALLEAKAFLKQQADRDVAHRRIVETLATTRARCQSLSGFIRAAWPTLEPAIPYTHGWHIDAICEHLEAVSAGEITRLLINIPPGTMKSLATGVFWPAWEWGPLGRPATRILGASYSEDYAKRDNRRMRDLVTSEWYQTLWPTPLVRSTETEFANEATGFRKGVPFPRLTGGRGDRVIIDDPHSTEGAESEAERRATIRIFTESVPTRLNSPEKSAIIVVMQRLHEQDVSGVILSRDLGYEHLCLPMEFEPDRRCVTSIGFSDPRTAPEELLFPARFPRAVVDRDKKVMGSYATAGQFQQRPAPRDGGLFKRSWFEIVDAIPARITARCRAWDIGATAGGGDYTAGLKAGRADDGVFYIEDVRRAQEGPAGVARLLKSTASQDGLEVVVRIPQDPGAAGKAYAASLVTALAGYPVRVALPTGDKQTRALPAAAQAEAGNIKLLRGPWNEAFLDELCTFPTAAHDDQVDALSDAINEIALGDDGLGDLSGMGADDFARTNPWSIG